jgi:hypothetical protein
MRRIRSHLTYANVMATIAVFLVLSGGTAVALTGTNTVQSDDLGPGAQVQAADVAANAVNGSDVVDNSLTGADVRDLSFQTLTLKNGWAGDCSGGGPPAIAKSVEGVVYFRGEMCRNTGTSTNPFAVPAGFHPSKVERIVVGMCVGRAGRIEIATTGEVTINSDPEDPNAAACFTSLAGANYTLPY